MANVSIFNIIVGKLCHKKKLYLVILFKVNENSEINFHLIILFFSLAIYLQIENGIKSLFNVKEIV